MLQMSSWSLADWGTFAPNSAMSYPVKWGAAF